MRVQNSMFVLINFAFKQSLSQHPYFSRLTIMLEELVFKSLEGHVDMVTVWVKIEERILSFTDSWKEQVYSEKKKRSGPSLSPVLLFATYTMLNNVWPSVILYTMLNFCFAAKSAPSSSWTLYLGFPLVQLSKHTEYLLYSRCDWKALVPWFISICYRVFLFVLFCFAVEKLESLYFQSAKPGEQEAVLLKTQTPVTFL